MRFSVVLVLLAALVAWLHAPLLAGGVLGAPDTDLFRAIWGFDHQARSFPYWIWTNDVAFPDGAKVIVLPFLSSILGWPLHALLGPWTGYSAWVCVLIWAGAAATAWWVREASGSGGAGFLAGGAMVTQPLLLLAETEGTPEHLAYWGLPLLLACLWQAKGQRARAWGAAAGGAGLALALDNPYGAVFAIPLTLYPLWKADRQGQLAFALASLCGAALLAGLYQGLSLNIPVPQRNANATSLLTWMDWEGGRSARPWDFTHPPTFVPSLCILAAFSLAILRPTRTWPWLLAAVVCLALSLGSAEENAVVLEHRLGAFGAAVAHAIAWVNDHASPSMIRFPRRWLVPFSFALWTAAGIGLSRVPQEWMRSWIAVAGVLAVTTVTLEQTGFRQAFPRTLPARPTFAQFVAAYPSTGAALVLPTRPVHHRENGAANGAANERILGFAGLDPHIGPSVDIPFLQVALQRKFVNSAPGLLTIGPGRARFSTRESVLQQLDRLATDPAAVLSPDSVSALVQRGLSFVLIDEKAFGAAGIERITEVFGAAVRESRHFPDGSGVTVLVVAP